MYRYIKYFHLYLEIIRDLFPISGTEDDDALDKLRSLSTQILGRIIR